MTSLRAIAAELGRGDEPVGLKALCDEFAVSRVRELALAVRARSFNRLPFPLGLPIDDDLNALTEPVLTRAAGSPTVCRFRGGILTEPIH
ncbi:MULTISPECIES: hypothetical protein [unclassified Frankia]|uniref:hypothetical protein n=1 Tax=unclassified Frankia TaxID=2632575 RepID=UPI001EF411FB|nr:MULTISPECIES: hypothetical protein [unclassified Frankia]